MEERSFPTARKALSGSSAKSGALGGETYFESSIRNSDGDFKSQYSIDDDLPINLQLVLNGDFKSRNNEVHIRTETASRQSRFTRRATQTSCRNGKRDSMRC